MVIGSIDCSFFWRDENKVEQLIQKNVYELIRFTFLILICMYGHFNPFNSSLRLKIDRDSKKFTGLRSLQSKHKDVSGMPCPITGVILRTRT